MARWLILLASVWVACLILGAILHLIRVLVWVALFVTLGLVLVGVVRPRAGRS